MVPRHPLLLAAALALFADAPAGAILINNGLAPPDPANVVTANAPAESLLVRNVGCDTGPCPLPGASTTVELASGAVIDFASVFDSSLLQMTGGAANFATASGAAQLELLGGGIEFSAEASEQASLLLDGGLIAEDLSVRDFASAAIRSGLVGLTAAATGSGRLTLSGGQASGLFAADQARITWKGGVLDGLGPDPALVFASGDARIAIAGGSFLVDGIPFGFGPVVPQAGSGGSGEISGLLASGEAFLIEYQLADSGQVVLVSVPESGAAPCIALGGAALLLLRRRRAPRTARLR
jgi:hypothetical protein